MEISLLGRGSMTEPGPIRKALLAALLAGMTAVSALAQEENACIAFCASDQKGCQKVAERETELERMPMFNIRSGGNSNSVIYQPSDMSRTLNQRQTQDAEWEKARAERFRACDGGYQRCISACASDTVPRPK